MSETILRYKGVIEGFYGPMWSHEERLHLIRHLQGWNMNIYIYSPRNDPYHRMRWEVPYPPDEMGKFVELAEECRKHRVEFSYAISPGSNFNFNDIKCQKLLLRKLQPFIKMGSRFFPIFYDDVSDVIDFDSMAGERLAERQGIIINTLVQVIMKRCKEARFLFCPTQYMTCLLYTSPSPRDS